MTKINVVGLAVGSSNGMRVRIVRRARETYVVADEGGDGVVVHYGAHGGDRGWHGWSKRRPVNALFAEAWGTSNGGGCWTEIIVRPANEPDWRPISAEEARQAAEVAAGDDLVGRSAANATDRLGKACRINSSGQAYAQLKNCTPHVVCVVSADGQRREIPPSGIVPRVSMETREIATMGHYGCPIRVSVPGDPVGLPDAEIGTLLIVSRATAEAARDRRDLVFPDDTVRNAEGQIVGCRAFAVPYFA